MFVASSRGFSQTSSKIKTKVATLNPAIFTDAGDIFVCGGGWYLIWEHGSSRVAFKLGHRFIRKRPTHGAQESAARQGMWEHDAIDSPGFVSCKR